MCNQKRPCLFPPIRSQVGMGLTTRRQASGQGKREPLALPGVKSGRLRTEWSSHPCMGEVKRIMPYPLILALEISGQGYQTMLPPHFFISGLRGRIFGLRVQPPVIKREGCNSYRGLLFSTHIPPSYKTGLTKLTGQKKTLRLTHRV